VNPFFDATSSSGWHIYHTAEDGSNVGFQAGTVADSNVFVNSTIYHSPDNATTEEKFRAGVRYLEIGAPGRARELIGEALASGYDNSEVRFYWVLAMLSKRSYRDLTLGERHQLERTAVRLPGYADDEWKHALAVICELLASLGSKSDPGPALRKLLDLQTEQRELIERHLDLVLTGGMKDSLWAEIHNRAVIDRENNGRRNRVWAYFQPNPIEARARPTAPRSTTLGDWFGAVAWSGLCAAGFGYIGWTVLLLARPLPTLGLVAAIAVGWVAIRNGFDWRYRTQRLRLKDLEHFGSNDQRPGQAPEGGFANSVDHDFDFYFAKYVARGFEREDWLAATSGIRKTLRDEIVEIYRESRISADRVRWLVRFLAAEVKKVWEAGAERDYRKPYQTPLSTKMLCSCSLFVFVFAAVAVIVAAYPVHPIYVLLAAFAAVGSGWRATPRWFHIISERWRYAEDVREHDQSFAEREEAFKRWKAKLAATTPSEKEMEDWLYCDTMVLLGNTLRHYKLAWRDVLAHAFLRVPAKSCKRARAKRGPWRYSRYDIRLFLVARDGVREVCGELDFERVSFDKEARRNYRFDAVSSVHVAKTGSFGYVLDLTLNNGPTRNVHVTEPETTRPDPDEDADELAKMNLDATGFAHSLHILEGIAAEGKEWMNRDPYANGNPEDLR
jgi:hypothetical protein